MTELLLPRLKQEIEARLAELRPLVEEIEQLEAAKAALLARSELPRPPAAARPAPQRRPARNGGGSAAPARRRRARATAGTAAATPPADGDRAPRGANRDAILKLVEERPGVSVAEIASVTKIAKPTVATTVSKLKREGVLADEAGGVKLASRQPLTISGPAAGAPRKESASDAEWDEAAPAGGDASAGDAAA
ncbi:winged helix-turn-helix transcriptional regulator [Conexibacter woesei]|uniref:Uncharacterized protein n=1 Tax=Conexibacter woesei (strain DSM 14684 / CCUG 47730 / CIP 108061 / JCM 11494 / NBRC 100937 / ID131577) TaxID=469383 RepID=D3F2N8_CONWI|nr:winged helix-turn-helix domain-containing protein [Conexibacter woesei]ADB54169.1 hypothetical protein Cwoe_5768 [Conexibacter woesei DSM 14684]